ncbi:MAG: helix-turn-helix domain-containing protein [Microbacterium sp.]
METARTSVRPYRQQARAEAAERTRIDILEATVGLALDGAHASFSLNDVAARAEVSVQTVLRHFGTREGLFEAALAYGTASITEERAAPAGDLAAAVSALVGHYERRGDGVIRLLAQEPFDARIAVVTRRGRVTHRRWVEGLVPPGVDVGDTLMDQLVVVTDVYVWKLLRRDRGLSRRDTEDRIRGLVEAVLAGVGEAP